jgi:4-amino-4-deoxy-L-arabinose transferase-like glycosyltransferase
MTRADRLALLLSLMAVIAAYIVADRVFQLMPHIEDEMAYVWQADAISGGHLTLPSPPEHESFLVPFVVDYHGQRFGKYPPGWPALLAIGVFFGARSLVNPLLAGLGVWLAYRLGKRVFSEAVGLLAGVLTLTSPFFLMNSGSLLSHPFGLVLSEAFALAWLDAWNDQYPKPWLPTLTAALSLGLLTITRPLTAVGLGLPFAIHGVYLLIKGGWQTRRRLIVFGLVTGGLASLLYVWQFAVTGSPTLNPYTLWWPYDKVGFGPGVGRVPGGHTLYQAYINTKFSLNVGLYDVAGWLKLSWIFLPFGLLATLRNWKGWLLASVFPSLVIFYLAYWIGANLFGPRYYYEGLYSWTLISAAGIAYLAGWPVQPDAPWRSFAGGWRRARPLAMTAILSLLLCMDLLFYVPPRVGGMYGLYGISRSRLEPFLTAKAREFTPALVIVHPDKWTEYGALLELEDTKLDTPFIFAISRGTTADTSVADDFPDRTIIHYFPSEPDQFHVELGRH